MKFYELKPTYENLCDTYLKDSIGRNNDIKLFSQILNCLSDSCSIALDGNWGSGKTFFVKQTKLFIDAHNNFIASMSEEDKNIFMKSEDEDYQPQVTVYYDAWENDNDNDPILSLVYSIVKNIDIDYKFSESDDVLSKAASILDFFTGKNWKDVINTFKSDDPLEEIRKEKDIEEKIKEFLDSILMERGNRLLIFIDELDRCKPSYAVRLLERIKHYFTNDRITFIFSINMKELQHTVKRYYGNEFDASRYLDRFFDLRISLPPADKRKFYNSINFNNIGYTFDEVCNAVIEYNNFSLREICKFVQICKIAAYEPTHDSKRFNFSFSDGEARLFCLLYIVPVMIGLKISSINDYEKFIEGKDCSALLGVVQNLKNHYFDYLLSEDETFNEDEADKSVVKLENKLKQVYDIIFGSKKKDGHYRGIIGKYTFVDGTREFLLRTVSLLSNYTNIERNGEI